MNEFNSFDAIDIANYFVDRAGKTSNQDKLNNLKLQKILYYSYVFFPDGKLFKDSIEKWKLGPVIPAVYHSFKHYGSARINKTVSKLDLDKFEIVSFDKILNKIQNNNKLVEYLNSIFDLLIETNAFSIVNKTHDEPMWSNYQDLINQGMQHIEYADSEIKEFFSNKEMNSYLES